MIEIYFNTFFENSFLIYFEFIIYFLYCYLTNIDLFEIILKSKNIQNNLEYLNFKIYYTYILCNLCIKIIEKTLKKCLL